MESVLTVSNSSTLLPVSMRAGIQINFCRLTTLSVLFSFLVGCLPSSEMGDSAENSETIVAGDNVPKFDSGELRPPFLHANAIWAGTALLDYDLDGWTDIFLTNGKNYPDALYRNLGDGIFEEVGAVAGVDSLALNGAVTVGDLDNDGDTDLIVSTECSTGSWDPNGQNLADGGKILYRNQGDGTFLEESFALSNSDLDYLEFCTISMELADLDADGFLDLVLSNGNDPDLAPPWIFDKHAKEAVNVLLYSDGLGNFDRAVTLDSTIVTFTTAQYDYNEDGLLDIITGEGGSNIEVYLQDDDGSFSNHYGLSGGGGGLWMGLAVADYDGDQQLDIYATNQGLSALINGYDNLDDYYPGNYQVIGDFESIGGVGTTSGVGEGINPFHSLLLGTPDGLKLDFGWPLSSPGILAGDVFDGMNGRYPGWVEPSGLARMAWAWGVAPLDIDADGWTDVALTGNNGSAPMTVIWTEEQGAGPGALFRNQEGQGFEDITWQSGVANIDEDGRYVDGRGIAVGDLNRDGYADYVVANRTYNPTETSALSQELGRPRVWLSQPRDGHWLQLDLVGTQSNRDGFGARVTLSTEDREQVFIMRPGGQTNSASESIIIAGLGDATKADIHIVWPSGSETLVANATADQRLQIEESD